MHTHIPGSRNMSTTGSAFPAGLLLGILTIIARRLFGLSLGLLPDDLASRNCLRFSCNEIFILSYLVSMSWMLSSSLALEDSSELVSGTGILWAFLLIRCPFIIISSSELLTIPGGPSLSVSELGPS